MMIIPEPSKEVQAVIDYLTDGNEIIKYSFPEGGYYEIGKYHSGEWDDLDVPSSNESIEVTVERGLFAEDCGDFIDWEMTGNFCERAVIMTLDERIQRYRDWIWYGNRLRDVGYNDLKIKRDALKKQYEKAKEAIIQEAHKRIDAFIRGESDNRNIT